MDNTSVALGLSCVKVTKLKQGVIASMLLPLFDPICSRIDRNSVIRDFGVTLISRSSASMVAMLICPIH